MEAIFLMQFLIQKAVRLPVEQSWKAVSVWVHSFSHAERGSNSPESREEKEIW